MIRIFAAVTVALVALVACGGSSSGPKSPTVLSVSAQPGDMPSGMVKCDLSGDINSFLDKEKGDPATYNQTKTSWESAQQKGATAAYTAFYTDNADHCSAIRNNSSELGAANYKVVVNFVMQFRDEKSAATNYAKGSVLGLSASSLKGGGAPVLEGTKTGLTQNSISLSAAVASQSYYVAIWQNKTFMLVLFALNVDAESSKRVATSENGRIK